MSLTTDQARTLAGSGGNVVSASGGKIGGLGQIYLDDSTGEPTWVTAKTGLFGTSESFVPLEGATVQGDDIVVGYDKDKVKDAPRVDPDGSLSPEEEDQLYSYYNLGGTSSGTDAGIASGYVENGSDADYSDTVTTAGEGQASGFAAGTGTRNDDRNDRDDDDAPGTVGHDTSGPTTDNAMTRSEEQLRVGKTQGEAARARLRKYVVTENVTQTVPVSREEVRVEREPITDANRGAAQSGPAISEEEHEVVLHAEQAHVEKEAVPVERVRMDKETVTEQQTVSDDVRKEQIEVDGDHDTRR
nr:YsnF/AvaK domain-containing protein [uncultured Friedmanniella sp.]